MDVDEIGGCRRSGNGGPQTCLPTAHGVAPLAAQYGSSSPANTQDPRERPSLVRRMTQDLLRGSFTRLAPEERRYQGRGTLRGSPDVSRDDRSQAGASGRRVPVSSLVLKRQAQPRSPEASGKGFHIGATRPRPAGRRSPWSPRRRHRQSLWQAKTTFSQDSLY